MLKSIGRWLKALGLLLTLQFKEAAKVIESDPRVVRERFEQIKEDRIKKIQQYKQAVGSLIALQEGKIATVKNLTADVQKLEQLKSGAIAKARIVSNKLQKEGKTKEEVEQNEEYQKCLSAYRDFASTLAEKQARIAENEKDIEEYGKRIADHKIQLQHLLRELENLKAEAAETVADLITYQQITDIADMINGIAEDKYAKDLQEMRELRQQLKGEARISEELAGTDTKRMEAEFIKYAQTSASDDEFAKLVGLKEEKPEETAPATEEEEPVGEKSTGVLPGAGSK